MKRLDNKGFTLVELIATIVLLALIMGIGSYSITKVIENSKKKDYELLIDNINDAAETFFIECKYEGTIDCTRISTGFPLSELLEYGFLSGNDKNSEEKYTLINPKDNENIANCNIKIEYNEGKVLVTAISPTGSCPTSY